MRPLLAAVMAAAVVLSSAAVATAAPKFWKNSVVNGNWSTSNNWSAVSAAGVDNGGVPLGGEAVNIVHGDGTARTVTLDVSTPSLGVLSIDLTGGGVTTDTLSITSNNNLTAAVLDVGGYNGTALTNGRGAVVQSAGTTTVSAGGDLILGVGSGSTGTYTLSGGAVVVNQSEFVALNGTGTFNHSGGTNTLNANAVGSFFVGYSAGATGTYNLSGTGALVSNETEYIGYSGTGIFTQSGGSHDIATGNDLYLGYNTGSIGTYNLSGGTLTAGNNLFVGNSGTGTLTIQGTGSVSVRADLSINSTSNVNLSGGTLRFENLGSTVVGTGGYSRLNYTSGTIKLAGPARNLAADEVVNALFGASPTIPAGKTLVLENGAEIYSSPAQTVRVDGGTLNSLSSLSIGKDEGVGKNGHLEITSGGIVNSGEGKIGFDYNTNSTATVSGPGSTWNVGGQLWVGGLGDGSVLNIRDGALVHVATGLRVWVDSVLNLDGGTLRFDDYVRFINGSNDGVFNFNAGTVQLAGNRSIGSDATIADILGAAPTLTTGKGLTVEGTATLLTSLTVDGGTFSAGSLASAEELHLQRGTLNVTNQAVTIGNGGVLGSALDVNEDMTVNVTLGITNQGLVTGDGQIGGTFANAATGELRAEPGRSLKLTGANNTNAGQISLYGGMLDFTQNLTNNAGAFISGNGTLKSTTGITNNGTMNFSGLANVVGDVTNSIGGKIISSGGGPTTFLDDVTNNGEIRTSAGSFTVFFGAATGAGTYTGTGTVNFEGDLKPGNSPAAVSFAGDVVFGAGSTLQIELGGLAAGANYDQLIVADAVALDGTLDVDLIGGFVPSLGNAFAVLQYASRSGNFTYVGTQITPYLELRPFLLANRIELRARPELDGDINLDGTVNIFDVGTVSDHWMTAGPQGDVNGDGAVNIFDVGVISDHWMQMIGSGAAEQVPEPATVVLAALGLVCLSMLTHRRRRIFA